ncbi:MAG: hypothetical protein IPH20_15105 [Bacteroidales bacterium]|nr:hypothetical protein [Bacteroidales bacterium]
MKTPATTKIKIMYDLAISQMFKVTSNYINPMKYKGLSQMELTIDGLRNTVSTL